jgi:deazaflavin-dependent oxidoreductase (nitroreductase family)
MTTAAHPAPATRPTQRFPRWFLRAPELVFKLGLDRFVPSLVMIETTGRRTGKPRRVVLDVARRDDAGLWVMAGDGLEARWVKNLLADPSCRAWHRGRRFAATATVGGADAGDLTVEIYRDRPFYTRVIYRLIGERVRNEADVRRLSQGVVAVRLHEA